MLLEAGSYLRSSEIAYLIQLATDFQGLVFFALHANHGAGGSFERHPRLRIAPAVMSRMKTFSDEMAKYGETYAFMPWDDDGSSNNHVSFIDDDTESAPEVFESRKD